MNNDKKDRLKELGADRLAEELVKLAETDDSANNVVERMLATPAENVKRFKSKLSGLKRMRRFVDWRGASEFADELESMLADLKAGVEDPATGVELVIAFYETDASVFEHCDDSNGTIGDVYRYFARDLFVHYASRFNDKAKICELVEKLIEKDNYGVRDAVIDVAKEYLEEADLRKFADELWKRANKEKDKYSSHSWLGAIESVARQLGDTKMFEKARRISMPKLPTAACLDIAQVYFDTGDAETALQWVERIPDDESYKSLERRELLLAIHKALVNPGKAATVAKEIFCSSRGEDTLQQLLDIIGEDRRSEVIMEAEHSILKDDQFSVGDTLFLIEVGQVDAAEKDLLKKAEQLNGDFYGSLLPLAKAMEERNRQLGATVVYRALLDSILKRAQSRYYHHGVRYLRKLDELAPSISEWNDVTDHQTYKNNLESKHKRKTSFWAK